MGQDPREIRQGIEATRAQMGDTVEALGHKTDVTGRAKDAVSDKVESVRSKMSGVGSGVSDATPTGGEMKQGARKAAGMAQENPLGLAVGALAIGFVAGLLLPSTKVEDERIGPLADQVKEKAKETGEEAMERGKDVALQAAESARDTVQEAGREQAGELRDSTQDRAQEARDQAGTPS